MEQLRKSFSYAVRGLMLAWREEQNFRLEVLVAVAVLGSAWWLRLTGGQSAIIILCITIVLSAEVLNTALEDLCNKVEPRHDPVIGNVKDLMAGFTLLVSLGSVAVGILIFTLHFLS